MDDATEHVRLDCEEPLRTIAGGLAALRLIENGNDNRQIQRALDFIIIPMEEAAREIETKLGLGSKAGGAHV